ncbi:MAG: urease accessory protein UreD [Pseudorhodoplanes sp.]|nr:MAG: urease accessory protein UreD [Pseudorhodoplanes sp.]
MRNSGQPEFRQGGNPLPRAVSAEKDLHRTFAANRARGRIALRVGSRGGRTGREDVHEDGSLRVRFPNADPGECEAVIVNTAGGIAGGDRLDLDIAVGPGARLAVCTAAAEKVYRTHGPDSEIAVRLQIAPGAALRWLPQETILFDGARMSRTIDIDLAGDGSLALVESMVFGRAAMGETVAQGALLDRWRVRRDGRLVFADAVRLDGKVAEALAHPAAAGGAGALATVLLAPGDDAIAAAVRALDAGFSGECGVSAWNGIALVRLCARDGAALRRDLLAVFGALGNGAPPRLWMN